MVTGNELQFPQPINPELVRELSNQGIKVNPRNIPQPNETHVAAIKAASELTGVSPSTLFGFAAQESGFRNSVKADTSSATGLMQFTNGTWRDMVTKYGDQYGLTLDGRTDPNQSAIGAALYIKQNSNIVRNAIGREPTTTDLYFAHFLGPGAAPGFLRADPNSLAKDAVEPNQANANKSVFYTRDGRPKTVAEVYAYAQNRVELPGIYLSRNYLG